MTNRSSDTRSNRACGCWVLTDGRTWSFYLPGEEGSFEDRRVYRLDLLERESGESAEILTRYLLRARVTNDEAIDDAVKELRDRGRRKLAIKTIRSAWEDIVTNEDPGLLETLSAEVETKCGIKPEPDDIVDFLQNLTSKTITSGPHTAPTVGAQPPTVFPPEGTRSSFELRGQLKQFRTAKGVMIGVLQEFTRLDPSFLEGCHRHPGEHG